MGITEPRHPRQQYDHRMSTDSAAILIARKASSVPTAAHYQDAPIPGAAEDRLGGGGDVGALAVMVEPIEHLRIFARSR